MNCEKTIHDLDKELAILRTAHEKDIEALSVALKLQALEYERRLSILNGEAERLRMIQATYLPRETWEIALKDIIQPLVNFKNNSFGRNSIISGVVAILTTLIVGYFLKG